MVGETGSGKTTQLVAAVVQWFVRLTLFPGYHNLFATPIYHT